MFPVYSPSSRAYRAQNPTLPPGFLAQLQEQVRQAFRGVGPSGSAPFSLQWRGQSLRVGVHRKDEQTSLTLLTHLGSAPFSIAGRTQRARLMALTGRLAQADEMGQFTWRGAELYWRGQVHIPTTSASLASLISAAIALLARASMGWASLHDSLEV